VGGDLQEVHETTAWLLFGVSLGGMVYGFREVLTSVEQVEGVIKNIAFIHFRVTAEDDKSIANE
jgi:surfactin synthase thioesterase subunit